MEKELPKWKPIRKGDKLPCQSFLRKKDGEILKLSTVGGVTIGQDAYYLPVDEVIEEIRNYPIEESEDERIRKELIEYHKAQAFLDGNPNNKHVKFVAWLENRGEQKPAEWSEEDEKILSDIIKDLVHPWNEYIPDRIEDEIKWLKNKLKSLKDRYIWKPSDEQMENLSRAFNGATYNNSLLMDLYIDLKKLKG